ncbi:MAG: response regulator transcription factor [Spirulina sp. SIO3F2]|nr:response regulator transcription factor [Spirulina sp. SIO3F2]
MLSLDTPKSFSMSELTTTPRVLVVEDETLIREMVCLALQEQGHDVVVAIDGRAAFELLDEASKPGGKAFDLIILDIMLPHLNGLDLCRLLRHNGNTIPILILSAKASETDRVLGLEVGADDYLTKPFSMRELIARCRALLRRQNFTAALPSSMLQVGEVALFVDECRVTVRGEEVSLSPKEFRLLELFMNAPRRVWSREQLIEQVWGMDFIGDTKTVDVHIRWLREKLEADPSKPEYLITVRGFGYRFG